MKDKNNIHNILTKKIEESIIRPIYFENIESFLENNLIKIIIGSRRSGKSYYLYSIIKYLINTKKISKKQIFYINKEWNDFDEIREYTDIENLFQTSWIDTKKTFFIGLDEIQEVDGFEKFVNSIQSKFPHAIIFITGSNSKLLSSKYTTLLSGRYIEKRIYPLSFQEFIMFSSHKTNWKTKNSISDKEYEKYFQEYIHYWGLPQIPYISNNDLKIEYLKWVYNTVFTKDIVEFFNIRNVKLLRNIHRYLFKELWWLFTAQNISKYFQSQKINVAVDTIINYLNYSQDAFLFNEIERYDIKGKKIFEINSKIYPLDTGIRNAIVGYDHFSEREKIFEFLVLQHLLIHWWKVYVWVLWNKEIDFIAERRNQKIYIQVAYLLSSDQVIQREFWNLEQIQDNHPKMVISSDTTQWYTSQGIIHQNIIDFLLNRQIP